jgi:hypothetical protein
MPILHEKTPQHRRHQSGKFRRRRVIVHRPHVARSPPPSQRPALRSPPRERRNSHPIAPPTSPSLSRSPPRERRNSHPTPILSHRIRRGRERKQVVRHPSSDTSHGAFTALFHCTHHPVPPLPKIVMVTLRV